MMDIPELTFIPAGHGDVGRLLQLHGDFDSEAGGAVAAIKALIIARLRHEGISIVKYVAMPLDGVSVQDGPFRIMSSPERRVDIMALVP